MSLGSIIKQLLADIGWVLKCFAEHNASFINGRQINVLCSTSVKEEWLRKVILCLLHYIPFGGKNLVDLIPFIPFLKKHYTHLSKTLALCFLCSPWGDTAYSDPYHLPQSWWSSEELINMKKHLIMFKYIKKMCFCCSILYIWQRTGNVFFPLFVSALQSRYSYICVLPSLKKMKSKVNHVSICIYD